MPVSVRYQFTQFFHVSAQKAFSWCTNFDPSDHLLMGEKNAKRQINAVAEGVLILTETFQTQTGKVEKQKLVQLYPDELSWVSTHLSGPNKHSQFRYHITEEGKKASTLNFNALHLEYNEKADPKLLAERLCKEDSDVWKKLAKAMEKELASKELSAT